MMSWEAIQFDFLAGPPMVYIIRLPTSRRAATAAADGSAIPRSIA
jgi:hypothetical protein